MLVSFTLLGCGKNFYFAGRTLPPSGLTQRVLIAVDNPVGSLQFVDAYYDIRHPYNSPNGQFSIGGFSGSNPVTIQNLPEERSGLVYNSGDGSLNAIDYGQEKQSSQVLTSGSIATSVFGSHRLDYFVAAEQNLRAMLVYDPTVGQSLLMNIPSIDRISMNSNATLVLGFVQNSNLVYTLFKLTQAQSSQFATPAQWQAAGYQDCEPQSLPKYCVNQVKDPNGAFDRPRKAIFSVDGQSIYVLNCGQECGGAQPNGGIVTIPVSNAVLNTNVGGPSGLNLQAGAVLPIPGGATNAIQSGNTLYVAGQHLMTDVNASGLFAGALTIVDLNSFQTTGQYSISDGTHNKMSFADDNTLWVGSQRCQNGERFAQNQAGIPDASGGVVQFGCLTRVDLASLASKGQAAITVDRFLGDLTGIANVEGLHKIYVGEGGQVHIYRTTDFTELDNSNVTVTGTVSDVAYMDGSSDANNTTY